MAHLVHLGPPQGVQRAALRRPVDGVAVGGGGHGGVIRALGPALDFQRVHPRLYQLGDVVDHAHIPAVEDKGLAVLLKHGEIFPGALLLHQSVLVAAGLGARPPGRVPPCHIVGQQAPPGVGHAHSAVDKGLHLQPTGGLGAELRYLVQRQLPGQNHPAGPQLVPHPGHLIVGDARLGGHMHLDMGRVPLAQIQHIHPAGDHRVRADGVQILQVLRQLGRLAVAGHGVAGDVDPDALPVGRLHRLGQPLPVEVSGKGPHPEGAARQIHRVRAVGQRHVQPLPVPRGGEQLRLNRHCSDSAGPARRARRRCG